ncbi:MAG: acetyltransferase [Gammaproteobacteria bacterium]|nr:acetyltransferase [Gammaproteobacteria bacterium]
MFLVHCKTHDLVEILDPQALFDPWKECVEGCYHAGEEMQDAQLFDKCELSFQSGECLPECWTNTHFRDNQFGAYGRLKVA